VNAQQLLGLLQETGVRFATGVPDSLLTGLTDALAGHPAIRHVVAASEGAAIALAAGHHLATGARALVYMQNSGLGNAVNPLLAMCHPRVYDLPMILVVGWRGAPGRADEPQHLPTGAITTSLLELMGIPFFILAAPAPSELERLRQWLATRGAGTVAILVKADAIPAPGVRDTMPRQAAMDRQLVLERVLAAIPPDEAVFAGIGHVGRELLQIRQREGPGGNRPDFLCVGAMGHASQFTLGFALSSPGRRVWCLDGDGAFTMHMGACNLVSRLPGVRFVHVLFDNGAHASVGGSEVCGRDTDYGSVARAAGYALVVKVAAESGIEDALRAATSCAGPALLWVLVSPHAKEGLPRPGNDLARYRDQFRSLTA